jgi:hypothetical protein
LCFCDAVEQLGEIIKLRLDNTKDPLLYTVGVLESNRRNVRNVIQQTRHVLVEAFDTLEDPVLQLKLSSMRRGVEGTIALTLSHGEDVDWEKVRPSHALRPEEMKEFFSKAKKYVPNLMYLILPVLTPLTVAPSLSAPTPRDPSPAKVA